MSMLDPTCGYNIKCEGQEIPNPFKPQTPVNREEQDSSSECDLRSIKDPRHFTAWPSTKREPLTEEERAKIRKLPGFSAFCKWRESFLKYDEVVKREFIKAQELINKKECEYCTCQDAQDSTCLACNNLPPIKSPFVDIDRHQQQPDIQMNQETILDKAKAIVQGQRRQDYGDAKECFERIAGMWSAYIGKELTSQDVAHLMIMLKVARNRHGFKLDSLIDICGYAYCAEIIHSQLEGV